MDVRLPRRRPGHRATEWATTALGVLAGAFGVLTGAPPHLGAGAALLVAGLALAQMGLRRARLVRSTIPLAVAGGALASVVATSGFVLPQRLPPFHAWGEFFLGTLLVIVLVFDAWLARPLRRAWFA